MPPTRSKPKNWKYHVPERGSGAVRVIEAAWEQLRAIERAIPPAVITLVNVESRHRTRGYFAWSVWKKRKGQAHEIGISPRLIGHPMELLATMLHEAAHAVLFESGQNGGMGSGGYYHRKEFRDLCRLFGLKCEFKDTRYGWNLTSWPNDMIPERLSEVYQSLRRDMPAGIGSRKPFPFEGRSLPVTGHTILACACEEGNRTIYVKKSMLVQGGIRCDFCRQEFRP